MGWGWRWSFSFYVKPTVSRKTELEITLERRKNLPQIQGVRHVNNWLKNSSSPGLLITKSPCWTSSGLDFRHFPGSSVWSSPKRDGWPCLWRINKGNRTCHEPLLRGYECGLIFPNSSGRMFSTSAGIVFNECCLFHGSSPSPSLWSLLYTIRSVYIFSVVIWVYKVCMLWLIVIHVDHCYSGDFTPRETLLYLISS